MAWYNEDPPVGVHNPFWLACMAGWAVFSLYWEAKARKAASNESSESKTSRGVHVFLVNLALVLVAAPFRGIGRLLPASAAIMTGGLVVEGFGVALAIWARRHLGNYWSGAIAIQREHRLTRTGPYRRLRHPIYTGILAMYVGFAVVMGERLGLIGLAVVVFAYWRKIRLEEARLDAAFGSEYAAHRRMTWALVPWIY